MLNRFNGNVEPFAVNATATNRTIFGDVIQSDDIDDNLNADFKKGWEIVGINDNPTKQDFNALAYTLGNLTSYLYQQGIALWNTNQKYYMGSRCIGSDGQIYKALTGTDPLPNAGNDPIADTINWQLELVNIPHSVGIGVTPAGNLDNGKGIALGDGDTGFRQNGDGVLEYFANDQLKAVMDTSGFDFTSMIKIAGTPVEESGTNANGFYYKFSNGLIIQFKDNQIVPLPASSGAIPFSWNFPIAVSSIWGYQDVSYVSNGGTLGIECGLEGAPNTSSLMGFVNNKNPYAITVILRFLHISFWK